MYHDVIPKDPQENIAWRAEALERSLVDAPYRNAFAQACNEDVLFFFNAACWLFEPRPKPKILPFSTWPHQDPAIVAIEENLGENDIGIEKSRTEGASWIACCIAVKHWISDPLFAAGFVSRNEDAVDRQDDPDSLMWKVDFVIEHLPWFMIPKWDRTYKDHRRINLDNRATIMGYSASASVMIGGRKTFVFFDELSRFGESKSGADYTALNGLQESTNCRLIVGTPFGPAGAYYDVMHADSNMVKLILDWKDNPAKNRGLYTVKDRVITLVDEDNQLPAGYAEEAPALWERLIRRGFRIDGTTRSPWYDKQCLRPGATPQSIAQELDRDYGGAGYPYFAGELIDDLKQNYAKEALHQGDLHVDTETLEHSWVENPDGPLKLWVPLERGDDGKLRPKCNSVSVGVDIAQGTGGEWSSMSAAMGLERANGTQVFSYTTRTMRPPAFAKLCIGLCNWFRGVEQSAFMVPEANGCGQDFIATIRDCSFAYVYRRKPKIGFWHARDDNRMLFSNFNAALADRKCVLLDIDLISELTQFIFDNGKVIHSRSKMTQDQSAKGFSHGDRTVAAACAWVGCEDRPPPLEEKIVESAPEGSMGWRINMAESATEESVTSW